MMITTIERFLYFPFVLYALDIYVNRLPFKDLVILIELYVVHLLDALAVRYAQMRMTVTLHENNVVKYISYCPFMIFLPYVPVVI